MRSAGRLSGGIDDTEYGVALTETLLAASQPFQDASRLQVFFVSERCSNVSLLHGAVRRPVWHAVFTSSPPGPQLLPCLPSPASEQQVVTEVRPWDVMSTEAGAE